MKHRVTFLLLFLAAGVAAWGQDLSLTFMSQTDAKFFVYLDGRLQNKESKGFLTIDSLEYRKYVVRIVIDEPYEVAVTKTIKPTDMDHFYKVNFNVVKERVFLKLAKDDADVYAPMVGDGDPNVPADAEVTDEADSPNAVHSKPPRRSSRQYDTDRGAGTTGSTIKKEKTTIVVDDD